MSLNRQQAFSLLELMCSVAVLGVLTMIAVPVYSGYMSDIRVRVVKDQLRAIHMQQQEYKGMYGAYFSVEGGCADDQKQTINNALFAGQYLLKEERAEFCISAATPDAYVAQATYRDGANEDDAHVFTINQSGETNF